MKNKRWMFAVWAFAVGFFGSAYAQSINFPQSHLGTWKGNLHIAPSGMQVPMSLQLGPVVSGDSVFEYVLTYHGPKGDDIRPYHLLVTDKSQGLFSVDEKNSILLNERLIGNKLISVFTVEGSSLLVTLELYPEEIIFEVISWPAENPQVSGGQQDSPIVYAFVANAYQRAVLKRNQK